MRMEVFRNISIFNTIEHPDALLLMTRSPKQKHVLQVLISELTAQGKRYICTGVLI